jgi:RNA polymerase sigma-70 factor (ECF subfamily)
MPPRAPSQRQPTAPTSTGQPPCACSEAEREAFLSWVGRLVHQHRAYLVALARREGLASEDAFDVVQEAFQTFLARPAARALVDAEENSRRSLITTTRNAARNRRRLAAVARPHESQDSVLASLPAESASVDDLLAAAEDEVRLRGCLQGLGDMQRTVVTLRMLDETDGENVARTLGITPAHVAVLLHRAKGNLLACMTTESSAPRRDRSNTGSQMTPK